MSPCGSAQALLLLEYPFEDLQGVSDLSIQKMGLILKPCTTEMGQPAIWGSSKASLGAPRPHSEQNQQTWGLFHSQLFLIIIKPPPPPWALPLEDLVCSFPGDGEKIKKKKRQRKGPIRRRSYHGGRELPILQRETTPSLPCEATTASPSLFPSHVCHFSKVHFLFGE